MILKNLLRTGFMLLVCGLLLVSCKKDSSKPDDPSNGNSNVENPNPGGDNPNNPGGNNSSNPGGNNSTNPGGNNSTNPGGDNPGNPGGNTDNPVVNVFTVTYDVDGGIADGDVSQTVKDGDSYKLSSGPKASKPDYRFDGWKDASGKSYKAGETIVVKADITLQAVWTFEPKLIFDGNGFSGTVPASVKFVDGLAAVPASSMKWDGYDFVGWSLDRDSRSADFKTGDKVQTSNKSVTLYAVWKSQKFVYTFYSHYGSTTFTKEQPFSAKDIANGNALFDEMLTGDYESDGLTHVGWYDVETKKEYKFTDVFDELKPRAFKPILINKSGASMEPWTVNKY